MYQVMDITQDTNGNINLQILLDSTQPNNRNLIIPVSLPAPKGNQPIDTYVENALKQLSPQLAKVLAIRNPQPFDPFKNLRGYQWT